MSQVEFGLYSSVRALSDSDSHFSVAVLTVSSETVGLK